MSRSAPPELPGSSGGAAAAPGGAPGPSGPELQLRELRERVRAGNEDLYRHLALYLQVLRQVLPVRVERAVFHLATQVQPRRYARLPPEDRFQLHHRLRSLVHRCTSLLTVEQLVSLAAQMARERERQEQRERQRLLQRFTSGPSEGEVLDLGPPSGSPAMVAAPGAAGSGATAMPEGSVNLDGTRPFSATLLQSFAASIGAGSATPPSAAGQPPAVEGDLEATEALREGVLEALEALQGDLAENEPGGDHPDDDADSPPPSMAGLPLPPLLQRLMGAPPNRLRPGDPWRDGRLPDDPLLLLRWLEGVEQALNRRLRNLSHAINVELLRSGLTGSLLPVSLLDGVLAGQIEVQPAPPNLLRLQLPFPAEDASPLLVMAVLLRRVDLELEEPRLRTCRRRLQQHRQEVRRMAQQFRRLQRRREAHEAEQLWLQDRHASLSPPG
ncbi:MAG: hypothetical protein VKK43_03705 [Synechococcaceae cyanobacterium]|nr:hypothetical protein [Synechococcaceae cyanobacterium]